MKGKMIKLMMLVTLASGAAGAQSAQVQAAWTAGNWAKAAQLAEAENDYETAARALNYLDRCPSAAQPKGQRSDPKVTRPAADLARKAMEKGGRTSNLLTLNANTSGVALIAETNFAALIKGSLENKAMYEEAIKIDPANSEAVGSYAGYMGKALLRGGQAIGITRSATTQALLRAQLLFNKLPEGSAQQRINKGALALNIGMGLGGINDPKLKRYYEAGLKVLGPIEEANPEARCLANLIRVNQGVKVENF